MDAFQPIIENSASAEYYSKHPSLRTKVSVHHKLLGMKNELTFWLNKSLKNSFQRFLRGSLDLDDEAKMVVVDFFSKTYSSLPPKKE